MEEKRPRGRPKGSLNKTTAEVKEAAMKYAPAAVKRLAHLMAHAESEAAQVAAANSILDRAMGKPKQALVGGDEDDAPIKNHLTVTFV